MKRLAPDFRQTFSALLVLMTAKEETSTVKPTTTTGTNSARQSVAPPTSSQKRPRPISLTSSQSKRSKVEYNLPSEPTTPDQPTKPSDPKLTGESSATVESQAEEGTKKLLVVFLAETRDALDREFGYLYWQTSGYKVDLFQRYSFICLVPKSSPMDSMKYTLGCETVKAINDGGVHIRYNLGQGNIDFRLGGIRPILSLEAKRRKSKRRNDPELPWQYAGQIYAEMLGQVCYKDFYENPNMEYQEVSTRSSLRLSDL